MARPKFICFDFVISFANLGRPFPGSWSRSAAFDQAVAMAAVPPRSPTQERRLRKKRSDARLRLRLLQDRVLLDEHHASSAPRLKEHVRKESKNQIGTLILQNSEIITLLSKLVSLKQEQSDDNDKKEENKN